MNLLDLPRTLVQDGLNAVGEYIAIAKCLDALAAHAGIHRAVALQQVEALAAVGGVGAVAGGELVEPVAAQTFLQLGAHEGRVQRVVQPLLLLGRGRGEHGLALGGAVELGAEGEHQVELVHVETQLAVDEPDVVHQRLHVLQVLAAERGGDLLGMRVACQQADVLQRARQPAGAAARGAVALVQGQRQVDAGADRDLVLRKKRIERRKLVEVGLDVR